MTQEAREIILFQIVILFKLISFFIRVISAFVFVLVLQIQWDGKSLEHYLVQFGKDLVAIKFLTQAGENSAKTLRSLGSKKEQERILSSIVEPLVQNMEKRLSLPQDIIEKIPQKKEPKEGENQGF